MAVGQAGEALVAMQKKAITQSALLAEPQPQLLLAPHERAGAVGRGAALQQQQQQQQLLQPAAAGSGGAAVRVARLSDTAAAAGRAAAAPPQPQQQQQAPASQPGPTARPKYTGGVSFPDLAPLEPPPVAAAYTRPRSAAPLTVAGPIPVAAKVEAAQAPGLPGGGRGGDFAGAASASASASAVGASSAVGRRRGERQRDASSWGSDAGAGAGPGPDGAVDVGAVLQASHATRAALKSLLSTLEARGEPEPEAAEGERQPGTLGVRERDPERDTKGRSGGGGGDGNEDGGRGGAAGGAVPAAALSRR